ncbi:type II toxin-antitoxin system VapC family toxin [Nostoc sp.]|uniref:type II toxin-antitoxin system VapC family toxin n=1 Tax=Nostoc sp. TaxID=1180 RepID=UPI002FF488DA
MQVLLDTHTLIWFFQGHQSFSDKMRLLIEDQNNEKLISIVSVWEMSIKQGIGKLSFSLPIKTFIEQQLALNDLNLLNINLDHIDVITSLPLQHRDPFDRILIAQAMVEKIAIISVDTAFDAYSITRLW